MPLYWFNFRRLRPPLAYLRLHCALLTSLYSLIKKDQDVQEIRGKTREQSYCYQITCLMESEAEIVMTKRSPSTSRFRRVCVFCGSSPGKKDSYRLAAIQLGHELVSTLFTNCIVNSFIRRRGTKPKRKKRWSLRVVLYLSIFQVQRNIDLVYGGGSVGLMGLVSQAVHDGGRHVLGL